MERNNNVCEKVPVTEIRWKGLTDKNSDKLYAPKQLLPQSDYDVEHKEIFERHVWQITGNYWMEQEKES